MPADPLDPSMYAILSLVMRQAPRKVIEEVLAELDLELRRHPTPSAENWDERTLRLNRTCAVLREELDRREADPARGPRGG